MQEQIEQNLNINQTIQPEINLNVISPPQTQLINQIYVNIRNKLVLIPVNNQSQTQTRKTVLIEFFVFCPTCGKMEIIERKKAVNWVLGVCNECNIRTWLKTIGTIKRFGRDAQFIKLKYANSEFKQFWVNIEDNTKQISKKDYNCKYKPFTA